MSHFYAMLSRMKYINRWGLMRNTQQESICEHSLEVAILAHALAVIHNRRFHGIVYPITWAATAFSLFIYYKCFRWRNTAITVQCNQSVSLE